MSQSIPWRRDFSRGHRHPILCATGRGHKHQASEEVSEPYGDTARSPGCVPLSNAMRGRHRFFSPAEITGEWCARSHLLHRVVIDNMIALRAIEVHKMQTAATGTTKTVLHVVGSSEWYFGSGVFATCESDAWPPIISMAGIISNHKQITS